MLVLLLPFMNFRSISTITHLALEKEGWFPLLLLGLYREEGWMYESKKLVSERRVDL